MLLENSQNSQENTCVRVSFLIKLQDISKNTFFTEHVWATASIHGCWSNHPTTDIVQIFSKSDQGLYRTLSNLYYGTIFAKSFIIDVWEGPKYTSWMNVICWKSAIPSIEQCIKLVQKKITIRKNWLFNFTLFQSSYLWLRISHITTIYNYKLQINKWTNIQK